MYDLMLSTCPNFPVANNIMIYVNRLTFGFPCCVINRSFSLLAMPRSPAAFIPPPPPPHI